MSVRVWRRRITIVMASLLALALLGYGALFIPGVYFRVALLIIRHAALRSDHVDWRAARTDADRLLRGARTTADTYPAIRLVLGRLGDNHSHLIPPEAARAIRTGSAWTPGLTVVWPERVVILVTPGGPAERAGIRVGDIVETVDGRPPKHFGAYVSVFGAGPAIELTLTRPGTAAPRGVRLAPHLTQVDRPAVVRALDPDLAYIELPAVLGAGGTFDSDAAAAIARVDAPPRCGWVVDLRRNEGGNMWPMLRAARPILGEETPGYFVSKGGRVAWAFGNGPGPHGSGDSPRRPRPAVAVLTSRLTASAGEAITIAFRGRPEARSFGEATAGLPTANRSFPLVDGALLVVTVGTEADRTGRSYEGPIEPDDRVAIDWAKIGSDDDEVVRTAARWLRGQGPCLAGAQ